jgi:hypothetical protein
MTALELLVVKAEIVRELQAQFVSSVEDLVALSAQPNEREALLADMKWTEPELEALLVDAQALLKQGGRERMIEDGLKETLGQGRRATAKRASMNLVR